MKAKAILMATVVGMLVPLGGNAAAWAQGFTPGHIYAPVRGGDVIELDQELKEVGRFHINNIASVTGCVFNDSGNLVLIAQYADTNKVYVIEVNSSGTILQAYGALSRGMLLGSYIDFDPVARVYGMANDDRITWLDADFQYLGSSEAIFKRASGVAFGPDGRLYATDQFRSGVCQFSPSFALEKTIPYGAWVATGMDWGSDGRLLVTQFGNGSLDRLDVLTGTSQSILSHLPYGSISDVVELPGGQLVTISYGSKFKLYTSDGNLLITSDIGSSGDGIAYFVPEPATLSLLAFVALAALGKKRGDGKDRAV